MTSINKLAQNLANGLTDYHRDDLHGSEELRDAVIIKTIALVALAYDIPPVSDKPLDIEETVDKLRDALRVIKHYKSAQQYAGDYRQ